jgi:hemin uptake protein HemP
MLLRDAPSHEETPRQPVADRATRAEPSPATRRIVSQRLLEGARELVIDHHGNEYHLRLTRNDKLILTK